MPRRVLVQVLPGCRGAISAAELRRVVNGVLAAERVAPDVAVEVVLANAETTRNLNRLFRGKDEPADVLSFPHSPLDADSPAGQVAFIEAPGMEASLGEIVLCVDLARQQSSEQGLPLQGGLAHLLVHGLLHLLSYDHEESEEESLRMQRREDELLAGLGYSGAYAHGH